MTSNKLITIGTVLIFLFGTTNAQNEEKSSNGSFPSSDIHGSGCFIAATKLVDAQVDTWLS